MADFTLESDAFKDGEEIPKRFTCEGDNASPALRWSDPPDGTKSSALIMDDPDAPSGTFVHWVAWGLDPSGGLAEADPAPAEGQNSFGETGYGGPCPPPGHGPHRYYFHLHALDVEPDVQPDAGREELEAAIEGHVLGTAELMGTYERAG